LGIGERRDQGHTGQVPLAVDGKYGEAGMPVEASLVGAVRRKFAASAKTVRTVETAGGGAGAHWEAIVIR
jgi:hypothetical protein